MLTPASLETATLDEDVMAIPALRSAAVPRPFPSVSAIVRDGHTPKFDVYMKCAASQRHPLQDGVMAIPLPGGGLLLGSADATTNAKGVAPEDGTYVVVSRMFELAQNNARHRSKSWPAALLRELHMAMRDWLNANPGSACGVAMSIVLVEPNGHAQVASCGDTQVLHWRPGRRWYQRSLLLALNAPPDHNRSDRRLTSSLGQGRNGPMLMELAHTQLAAGDLLLMGSDGGLPWPDADDLRRALQGYTQERKRGLVTLSQLGESLDQRARRKGPYDDDRSIVLIERL